MGAERGHIPSLASRCLIARLSGGPTVTGSRAGAPRPAPCLQTKPALRDVLRKRELPACCCPPIGLGNELRGQRMVPLLGPDPSCAAPGGSGSVVFLVSPGRIEGRLLGVSSAVPAAIVCIFPMRTDKNTSSVSSPDAWWASVTPWPELQWGHVGQA